MVFRRRLNKKDKFLHGIKVVISKTKYGTTTLETLSSEIISQPDPMQSNINRNHVELNEKLATWIVSNAGVTQRGDFS